MLDIIFDPILYGIGKLYLSARYPDEAKREEILLQEYGNSYASAGGTMLLQLFMFLFMLLLFGGVIILAFKIIFGSGENS